MSEARSSSRVPLKMVWIIDEGSPGHLAQSTALAVALEEELPAIEFTELRGCRRFNGLQRSVIRWMMGPTGRSAPVILEKLILSRLELPENEANEPDLIISSGGKSVFVACILAKRFEVPYIFIGERKPFPSEWFHTVLTPSGAEQGVNDVLINLIPTAVTPGKVAQAAADYKRPEGRLWAMIIGGSSRSHPYTDLDWQQLATGMNQLAELHGIRWLLSTSRRTGAKAEALLKQSLQAGVLADSIWWDAKPEKRMLALLGAAERVFVTQDSVTMVTEAVCSGCPVTVVYPNKVDFPSSSFVPDYLNRLEASGVVSRISFNNLLATKRETKNLIDTNLARTIVKDHLFARLANHAQYNYDPRD